MVFCAKKADNARLIALAIAAAIALPRMASADVVTLYEGQVVNGVTVNIDDTYIRSGDGGTDTNFGTLTSLAVEDFGGNPRLDTTLIAYKDLFAMLPKTVGGSTLNITSAQLTLTTLNGTPAFGLTAARVTTNWLPLASGANQGVVTFNTASGSTSWSAGSFSSADYDTVTNYSTYNTGFGALTTFDVTNMVNAMYGDNINNGFALMNGVGQSGYYDLASEEYNPSYPQDGPVLTITYNYVAGAGAPAGTGTWQNGSGDGKWTTNTAANNNWATGIPNGIDQVATFDDTATGGAGTVDLNGDKIVGGLVLHTALVGYTLGLPGTTNTLTFQTSGGDANITVTGGAAHTINALVNLANNTGVSLASGTSLNLVGTVSGTGTLNLVGSGVLKLSAAAGNTYAGTFVSGGTLLVANTSGSATGSANVVLNGGTLGGSGSVSGTVDASAGGTIFPSATLSTTSTTTLTLGGLTTSGSTTLQFNLVTPGNSHLVTTSNSDMIVIGANGLTLNGGTVSLANHSTGASSLGFYKVISDGGPISGTGLSSLSLPATANNVVYTFDTTHDSGFIDIHRGFLGDVDDSGFVDINDLAILAANWQQVGGWAQGNFLGDPVVDINDLAILAANWQTGIASFGESADSLGGTSESFQQAVAGIVFGGGSQVPEPTSLALLGLGAVGLLGRRHRNHPGSR